MSNGATPKNVYPPNVRDAEQTGWTLSYIISTGNPTTMTQINVRIECAVR